jgi:hypothetical protein
MSNAIRTTELYDSFGTTRLKLGAVSMRDQITSESSRTKIVPKISYLRHFRNVIA